MAVNSDNIWMIILGGVIMIVASFIIGANDVANSFGTSVGSRALSLKSACILASIFETIGAIFIGSTVVHTFENEILDYTKFNNEQSTLMFGMISSLIGSMLWLFLATYFGIPVSTTHSLIGAFLGFAIASGYIESINWITIGFIAISWISSPLLSGIFSALFFSLSRTIILRRTNSLKHSFRFMWIFITLLSTQISISLIFGNPISLNFLCLQSSQGSLKYVNPCNLENWANTNLIYSIPITFGLAFLLSIISNIIIYKYARNVLNLFKFETIDPDEHNNQDFNYITLATSLVDNTNTNLSSPSDYAFKTKVSQRFWWFKQIFNSSHIAILHKRAKYFFLNSLESYDQKAYPETPYLHQDRGENFNQQTEVFFGVAQVYSACFASLSHGANDIANSVAPFSKLLSIYQFGVTDKISTLHWIYVPCCVSLCLGLSLYGYKVIRTVGFSMIKITPSRGLCIQSSTALTVVTFSKLGIPLSSTYCQIGSIFGLGLIEPSLDNTAGLTQLFGKPVNFKLFFEVFLAWILTIFCSGVITALFFLVASLMITF